MSRTFNQETASALVKFMKGSPSIIFSNIDANPTATWRLRLLILVTLFQMLMLLTV